VLDVLVNPRLLAVMPLKLSIVVLAAVPVAEFSRVSLPVVASTDAVTVLPLTEESAVLIASAMSSTVRV
jgi:hypothetical protein